MQPSDRFFCRNEVRGITTCAVGEERTQAADQRFVFVFNEGGRRESEEAVFESFWLQLFVHGRRVLQWSADRITDAFSMQPPGSRPSRLKALNLQPLELPSPRSPRYIMGPRNAPATIEAPLRTLVDNTWRGEHAPPAEPIPMMPTLTAHEVAHHVLSELGAIGYTTQVEEGLADALAALANGNPRMFWTSAAAPGPAGYDLSVPQQDGVDGSPYISELRAGVAHGFWRLKERLEEGRGDPFHAARLLLRWARMNGIAHMERMDPMNEAMDGNARTYNDPAMLLEELSRLNGMLVTEFQGRHDIREDMLRDSFRHCHFLGGVPFVRGDANLDSQINITDAVVVLLYLFAGSAQPRDCRDAMDADDNDALEVTDALRILGYLFLDTAAPAAPFPACGVEEDTFDDPLCCAEFVCPR